MAAMANYDDATKMVEAMLEHESIKKAIRVYKHSETSLDADRITREYCEFMALKILSGDFSAADAKLSPGGVVDGFWHCHVLDTVGYSIFFNDILPPLGPLVHHDAEKSQDDQEKIKARQEKTKEVYQKVFGGVCPFFFHCNRKRGGEIIVIRNPIQLFYKEEGKTRTIDIGRENTVFELKLLIQQQTSIAPEMQCLNFAGKILLEDVRTLSEYNIQKESTIQFSIRCSGC